MTQIFVTELGKLMLKPDLTLTTVLCLSDTRGPIVDTPVNKYSTVLVIEIFLINLCGVNMTPP